uniref:Uncharacterized protein n=1 Tax=Lactuca sativa TaxID=4236 RepID=A0A9R1W507_LACSA|nr:hypothetical protein LSAT_V11C300123780 [Lactuca sativa]
MLWFYDVLDIFAPLLFFGFLLGVAGSLLDSGVLESIYIKFVPHRYSLAAGPVVQIFLKIRKLLTLAATLNDLTRGLKSAVDEELANLNEVVMKRYDGGESKGNFDPEKYI